MSNCLGNKKNSGQKVLVVEDNRLNLKLFIDILEYGGFDTLGIIDGSEAVHSFSDYRPDLVIMDLQLGSISGLGIVQEIKLINSSVPIIAITAFAIESDKKNIVSQGCIECLIKPISVVSLLDIVNKILKLK